MNAVVLAAGDGGRLLPLTAGLPKPLLRVAGRPLINHALDALRAAGVDHATIVVGYHAGHVRSALAVDHPRGVTLDFVQNDAFMLGNARSLWAARDHVRAPFVLAMGDHLIEPALVRALVRGAGDRSRLAVETAATGDQRAGEATLALVRGGAVVDLGKGITDWNALDTGTFWCTPAVFDVMTPELRDGEAGAVFAALARAGALDAADVTGCRWIDVDTEDDLRAAEAMLGAAAAEPTVYGAAASG